MLRPWPAPGLWLARRSGWLRLGLAALAGAGTSLAQAPISTPIALFLALPVLVWLVDAAPGRWAAARIGWAAGFGAMVTGLHWIGHAFLVDADRFAWLMPFAVMLLPAGLGLFWAAAFWAAKALWRPHWARVLVFALALATAELARATLFTGLPWGLPAYGWVETPVMQAARLLGPHALTLATLAIASLPLVVGPKRWAFWAALGLLALLWADGTRRLAEPQTIAADAPVLRLVQPNAAQHLKWQRGHRERFLRRQMALSAEPPGPLGPPVAVLWPETAITFLPQDQPEAVAAIAESTQGGLLVTGALFYAWTEEGTRRWSNALMAVDARGRQVARYDKHHLVPFGEYLPLRGLLERLGLEAIAGMGGAGFVPGPGPQTLSLPGLPPVSPLICYEMIFPGGVVAPGARPDWMMHLTNDAWFGRAFGPQQHLAQARIRAIEQGLPVVRAANTGISAVIDAHGRLRASLPLGEPGRLDAKLPPPLPPTPYARLGDIPALALFALMWGAALIARRRQSPNAGTA